MMPEIKSGSALLKGDEDQSYIPMWLLAELVQCSVHIAPTLFKYPLIENRNSPLKSGLTYFARRDSWVQFNSDSLGENLWFGQI